MPTVYPRCLDPFDIVRLSIKWAKTAKTYSHGAGMLQGTEYLTQKKSMTNCP